MGGVVPGTKFRIPKCILYSSSDGGMSKGFIEGVHICSEYKANSFAPMKIKGLGWVRCHPNPNRDLGNWDYILSNIHQTKCDEAYS